MMGMVRAMKDPKEAMGFLMQNNPQMQQVMKIVDEYGGDSMKAFRAMAEKAGVDPEEILGMLK